MKMGLFLLIFAITNLVRQKEGIEIGNIHINTNQESIIFYSYAIPILRNHKVKEEDINCLKSELKNTGLFNEIQIQTIQCKDGLTDIQITPKLNPKRGRLLIGNISINGLNGIEKELRTQLFQKGLKVGIPLTKFTYSEIEGLVIDSIEEIHLERKSGLDCNNLNNEETLDRPWVGIKLLSATKVQLIIAPKYDGPCSCQNERD